MLQLGAGSCPVGRQQDGAVQARVMMPGRPFARAGASNRRRAGRRPGSVDATRGRHVLAAWAGAKGALGSSLV